jgi:hypothetical protein
MPGKTFDEHRWVVEKRRLARHHWPVLLFQKGVDVVHSSQFCSLETNASNSVSDLVNAQDCNNWILSSSGRQERAPDTTLSELINAFSLTMLEALKKGFSMSKLVAA